MALKAPKNSGGGDRVPQPTIEAGSYPNRLVQIIDLGLQPQRPYKGQDKAPMHEIMLTYELVDTFMIDENGNELEDKPRWVSETLPLHSIKADKAKSTQRYLTLDPENENDGDWSEQLGKPSNVTLIINQVGDKTYTNVAGLSKMRDRDADRCPALKNPTKLFDLSEPSLEVFESLPEWIQEKIKGNLEYAGSPLEKLLGKGGKAPAKAPKAAPAPAPEPEEEDNRPF